MDALVMGTVVLEDECLYLVQSDIRHPVIWPHGTSWQEDPPAVRASGGTVALGGYVSGGGGYMSAEGLRGTGLPITDEVIDKADACTIDTYEIAVFNPGTKVTPAEPTDQPSA